MSEQYDRLKTALADRYIVERKLGEGGMATVYLAQDVKHHRKVALKVLLPELAAVLGADRFLNEIRVTANLHHPNIVQLYDSGEADGDLYYVMPFIEGESLRDKINRDRQLSVEEAISITRAVADALDYAHRREVIHRDIKPDNIMLHEGTPMVADFGIALAVTSVAGDRITATGLSLGTPSYMSPEQATGDREAKPSTDIYALGSVLYEMLAGDPPFTGSNVQAVIAKVVGEKPVKLRVIRDAVPAHVEAAVDKALAKVPADRFKSTQAFADALVAQAPAPAVQERTTPSPWSRIAQIALPVAAVAALAWVLFGRGGGEPVAEDQSGATITRLTSFYGWEMGQSWSPDGSQIAYAHIVGGDADIATLSLGGGEPHILTADSPADEINPRWSPDGTKIAFLSDRGAGSNIYWIPPTGGAERLITTTNIPFLERMNTWFTAMGPNPWSPDSDDLLFSRLDRAGDASVWKIDLSTGNETKLTTPPLGAEDVSASFSPDGTRIVFTRFENGVNSIMLLRAEGGEPEIALGEGLDWLPAWFPDNERLALTSFRGGAPNIWEVDLRSGVWRQLTSGGTGAHFTPAVASNGAIAYNEFDHQVDIYWAPVGDPTEQHRQLTSFTNNNAAPRVSQDGRYIVYWADRTGNEELYVLDRTSNQHRNLTDNPANDRLGDWSPDGIQIVFMSNRGGAVQLWVVNTQTGVTRLLTDHQLPWSTHSGDTQAGPRWAPDGTAIAYLAPVEGEGHAMWLVDPDGGNRRTTTIRDAFSFDWYKDGQRVIYTRRAPDGSGLVELRAAHLGSGEDVLLRAGTLSEVSVSRDGSALTFIESVSHFTMDLLMQRLNQTQAPDELPSTDGEPRQITFGNGEWHVHNGGWAWDGSGVVYSRDRDFGDLFVIEPNR
jgi:Tol biopolymer transport system component/tRNA A-37 threonylcarbamoyl transferase component Bud32